MCGVKLLQCCGAERDKKNNILGKTTLLQQCFGTTKAISFLIASHFQPVRTKHYIYGENEA